MTDEGEEAYKKDLDPAPFDYDSEGQQVPRHTSASQNMPRKSGSGDLALSEKIGAFMAFKAF